MSIANHPRKITILFTNVDLKLFACSPLPPTEIPALYKKYDPTKIV
jgi:hypothetical protein